MLVLSTRIVGFTLPVVNVVIDLCQLRGLPYDLLVSVYENVVYSGQPCSPRGSSSPGLARPMLLHLNNCDVRGERK